ncbi:hypothetical protein NBRC116583_29760 [Arenicella sp. 4NH20-0111]|uniref:LuxR C-terminal-related transcriptional regulator n=1 Tax=Arenicella sp. 4NH20-0111 TaxID=3127648 RepID=UPI0031048649
MSDSNFSSLIYRIIGKPESWHDDYIVEMMQQYLNEADSVDDPLNLLELEAGEQILSRLSQGNVAINAFNSLLDKSSFQMIILDDQLQPLYHNQIAESLFAFVQIPQRPNALKPELVNQIKGAPNSNALNHLNSMHALDFFDQNGEQVYIRTLQSQVKGAGQPTLFHILMVLNSADGTTQLNHELVAQYQLTEREQNVLMRLVHGESIKDIAVSSFVTENTVRSHLKAIFRKTNTKSQGALISLILTHESQVLDSYFDTDITTLEHADEHHCDKELTLASGHVISYGDYGPPDGRPLIVFHSGFGSRLAIPNDYKDICDAANRRIIIPDRPGLGRTLFIEGHPEKWNEQLQEFIDLLNINEYEVLGSIIACQMAMSFAAQADQRLTRLILTSPVYLNEDSHADFLTEILAPAAKYVKLSPQFAKEIYTLWLKAVTLNLDAHYPSMLEESVGESEREMFKQNGVIQLLTDVFKEGARQSLDGILNEMAYCMTPLHLDLSKLTLPVDIWYGTDDKRITREGVDVIFDPLPNKTVYVCEGYSEHIYYSKFEEIVSS